MHVLSKLLTEKDWRNKSAVNMEKRMEKSIPQSGDGVSLVHWSVSCVMVPVYKCMESGYCKSGLPWSGKFVLSLAWSRYLFHAELCILHDSSIVGYIACRNFFV